MTCHDLYPELNASSDRRRIVVGVDGSAGSSAALRWAVETARFTDDEIVAVYAIAPIVAAAYTGMGYAAIPDVDLPGIRADAADQLHNSVVAAVGVLAPRVREIVVDDPSPAHALLRRAADAAMLVVGAHHHHGLGFLLGSTSATCVRKAPCPVVVVPALPSPREPVPVDAAAGSRRSTLVPTGGVS